MSLKKSVFKLFYDYLELLMIEMQALKIELDILGNQKYVFHSSFTSVRNKLGRLIFVVVLVVVSWFVLFFIIGCVLFDRKVVLHSAIKFQRPIHNARY